MSSFQGCPYRGGLQCSCNRTARRFCVRGNFLPISLCVDPMEGGTSSAIISLSLSYMYVQVDELKASGTRFFTIGIGDNIDPNQVSTNHLVNE